MKYLNKLKYFIRGIRAQKYGEVELKLITEISKTFDIKMSFDIGGNMGEYAYTFEKCSKSLVIVEPIPTCCEYLCNVKNKKTVVVQAAVSDSLSQMKISVPIDLNNQEITALATLNGDNFIDDQAVTYDVRTIRLKDLVNVFGFPDLVKIDVEGAEYATMYGADLANNNYNDTIFIVEVEERHTNKHPKEFFAYMQKYDFDVYVYDNERLLKLNSEIICHTINNGHINFVFFKKNMAKKLIKLIK